MMDILLGPTEDNMSVLTTRILDESTKNNSSKFTCICYQDPNLSNNEFDQQFESLKRELEGLRTKF